jgi:hypothetical protein
MMADALGLKELPDGWDVHHIDEDKKHNELDNFALVTPAGHVKIHYYLRQVDSISLKLKRSMMLEILKSMTSQ